MKWFKKTYLTWHEYAAREREARLPDFISKTAQRSIEDYEEGGEKMSLDQRTIGDLLSSKLMKLPMKISQMTVQQPRKKCSYCGS